MRCNQLRGNKEAVVPVVTRLETNEKKTFSTTTDDRRENTRKIFSSQAITRPVKTNRFEEHEKEFNEWRALLLEDK